MTDQEYRIKRSEIFKKIFELEVDYYEKDELEQKRIDKKLKRLGEELDLLKNPKKEKSIQDIFEKGKNMTINDIQVLLNYEVSLDEIAEKSKVSKSQIIILKRNLDKRNYMVAN